MNDKTHIAVSYPEFFPPDFGEVFCKDIIHSDLTIATKAEPQRIWSSLEWTVPGLIAVYLLKPYFESFLKEAGKEHYAVLKRSLSSHIRRLRKLPVHNVAANTSPNKLDKSNSQSMAISIYIQIRDGRRIKLLFDNELSADDWEETLFGILDRVEKHYQGDKDDELTLELKPLDDGLNREVYARIDHATKQWVFMGLRDVVQESSPKINRSDETKL
jgi:hypothetical protein